MDDSTEDPIVTVRLRQSESVTLMNIIKREEAYTYFTTTVKSLWIYGVAIGVLALWGLYEKIYAVNGVVK